MTLGLLCVSALVSGAETSFFSLSHNDIRRLRKRTTASAEAVLRLLTNVDLLLATILVVNNLVNICIVILTSSIIDSVFTFLRFEFLFKTVLVTFLLLLFGEILPKVLAQTIPVRFAQFAARPLTVLNITDDYETVKKTIIESGFSRIPVYEDDIDNIKGTLYVKDLLPYINHGSEFGWQQLVRKPYFVPEHKKINDLLADFQSNKIHMAIVVDEYGSTLGLVSLEDIIEEIVGEISDESDADESFFTRLDEKCFIFDGKSHLGDFERVLGLDEEIFNDVKGEAETLAGLMLELKRDFPRKGDVFTSHDIRFTVQEMDGHRIDKIRVDLLA